MCLWMSREEFEKFSFLVADAETQLQHDLLYGGGASAIDAIIKCVTRPYSRLNILLILYWLNIFIFIIFHVFTDK